jgi:hypothetical protein
MYISMYKYMYVCIYTCMYVCIPEVIPRLDEVNCSETGATSVVGTKNICFYLFNYGFNNLVVLFNFAHNTHGSIATCLGKGLRRMKQ